MFDWTIIFVVVSIVDIIFDQFNNYNFHFFDIFFRFGTYIRRFSRLFFWLVFKFTIWVIRFFVFSFFRWFFRFYVGLAPFEVAISTENFFFFFFVCIWFVFRFILAITININWFTQFDFTLNSEQFSNYPSQTWAR